MSDTLFFPPLLYPLSETAVCIEFGQGILLDIHQKVNAFNHTLLNHPFDGFVESLPAYTTLQVFYDPEKIPTSGSPTAYVMDYLRELLLLPEGESSSWGRKLKIPICYDAELGPDLEEITQKAGISKEEFIQLFESNTYHVYMLGFLPGFAYMGGLNPQIASPRKQTPRSLIRAGSVGIAGLQTGIYPLDSPGGWQIIGRTPLSVFEPRAQNPFLFHAGDQVQYYSISRAEFDRFPLKESTLIAPIEDRKEGAKVLKPGVWASIQDGGRRGFRAFGVPLSGYMDQRAARQANLALGNSPDSALIECAMGGLQIEFYQACLICLGGGGKGFINGQEAEFYNPILINPEDVLEIRFYPNGLRTYIAFQGGILSLKAMNSCSAYPPAGIGSLLQKAQPLYFNAPDLEKIPISRSRLSLDYLQQREIRIIAGHEQNKMQESSILDLYGQSFRLSQQSNRMGYRLEGVPLYLKQAEEMISTGVQPGTLQLTSGGQLIILMADCQTTGGYPRVGQVAQVDLPALAQMKAGDTINFKSMTMEEAESLYLKERSHE